MMVPRFLRTSSDGAPRGRSAKSRSNYNVAAIRRDVLALTATSTTLPPSSAISIRKVVRYTGSSRCATSTPSR